VQRTPYRFFNAIDALQYVVVPEPQHPKTCIDESGCAFSISFRALPVLPTVYLDYKHCLKANEI
jgi:hypothetical protein